MLEKLRAKYINGKQESLRAPVVARGGWLDAMVNCSLYAERLNDLAMVV